MRYVLTLAALMLALATAAGQCHAADDLATRQLVDQARHWQQKRRDDLACEVWRRLLLLDPKHAESLVNLGLIEARTGHLAEADALLNRARALSPPPGGTSQLAAALSTARGEPSGIATVVPPRQTRPGPAKLPASTKSAARAIEPGATTNDPTMNFSTALDPLRVKPQP